MTLKEFSQTHSVPYYVVHKASFMVKPVSTMDRDNDYDESDLHNACMKYVKRRLHDLKGLYEQYVDVYNNLKV